jgi:hypothetical protein
MVGRVELGVAQVVAPFAAPAAVIAAGLVASVVGTNAGRSDYVNPRCHDYAVLLVDKIASVN